ncbi:MarR family winged helix-turn-helix transcriptional regulator [Clostridium luticellarii]|jgi:DNA-binding MarR family transcriptional regulator|uniref:MarR family winged helix-turn-helix transcriptional regulator n=1 Tax=Clostridium luticellarii TaxID=1691940 RepID=UPI00235406F3|nr:MarR family transcriptional regulator [Clostridium luticellarii]MCI1968470.1 MarR family winged helix-turn-helix transcriptional regulator [Clostridium luticellarii]MCI1995998.1 MarR family winged helix-turn-helix transcriptional regulator [Clostridium luticellarii]MCI2039864.1 MarR family winged helix-turn-helix transcriptional regulator [Clostridium luticellarii]
MKEELIEKQSDEIIRLFKSIHTVMGCKLQSFAKRYGFTAPQIAVIFHLYKAPGITLNELSSHLMLTKSTVSGIVTRLVNQGVVIREIPKANRRTIRLSISEDFKRHNDILNMKKALISGCISDIIRNMDPDKVEEFIKALKNFTYLLNKHSPK